MADRDSEALREALRNADLRAAFQQLAPFLNKLPHQPVQRLAKVGPYLPRGTGLPLPPGLRMD